MNFLVLLGAALMPMVIGFIYYHEKVLGKPWMAVTGMTDEKVKEANMPLMLIVSFVFSVLLALGLYVLSVHQTGLQSLFFGDENNALL
jgi:hypothetical protein